MGLDTFEKAGDFLYKCKTCGAEVPSGIFSISGHWAECSGKGFVEGMKKMREEKGSALEISDIDELLKK